MNTRDKPDGIGKVAKWQICARFYPFGWARAPFQILWQNQIWLESYLPKVGKIPAYHWGLSLKCLSMTSRSIKELQ